MKYWRGPDLLWSRVGAAPAKKKREFYQYLKVPAMGGTGIAYTHFRVQTCHMRKTSDIIWQDAQHQVLFEILDLIKEPGADRQVICKLEDYTEYHFSLEEQYMAELEYPGREEHIRAHDLFRQEISRVLQEGTEELDAQFREIIATFLAEWLKRHVFGIDKKLEDFILRSSAK